MTVFVTPLHTVKKCAFSFVGSAATDTTGLRFVEIGLLRRNQACFVEWETGTSLTVQNGAWWMNLHYNVILIQGSNGAILPVVWNRMCALH